MMKLKQYLKKLSKTIKCEQPAYCTQKTDKQRALAVNNPERGGSRNPEVDEKEEKMCPPLSKLR